MKYKDEVSVFVIFLQKIAISVFFVMFLYIKL